MTQNSLSFEKLSLPVGKTLDISFAYDLTENNVYGPETASSGNVSKSGDPYSNRLLYPLKPVCNELRSQVYQPWITEPLKAAATAQGNYFAVCDLDDTAQVQLSGLQPARMDTWQGFFSYAPQRLDRNELGHLYGIRSVSFVIEACIKLQVRAPGATTWTTTTQGVQNCGGTDSDFWTPVFVEKTFTIYDNTDVYKTVTNLSSILQRFKSSAVETYTNMKFNNEPLSGDRVRHLY